jgi:Ni,Fe-hydrogenase I cytochrome b subunit
MLDNKILISIGGIVLLAPAMPFLVLMLVGLIVVGFALYYLVDLMDG